MKTSERSCDPEVAMCGRSAAADMVYPVDGPVRGPRADAARHSKNGESGSIGLGGKSRIHDERIQMITNGLSRQSQHIVSGLMEGFSSLRSAAMGTNTASIDRRACKRHSLMNRTSLHRTQQLAGFRDSLPSIAIIIFQLTTFTRWIAMRPLCLVGAMPTNFLGGGRHSFVWPVR